MRCMSNHNRAPVDAQSHLLHPTNIDLFSFHSFHLNQGFRKFILKKDRKSLEQNISDHLLIIQTFPPNNRPKCAI